MREWLYATRKLANLSHSDVSKACGCTRSYYSMIEKGVRTPSVPLAVKIANHLSFEWTLFFDVNGNKV